MGRARRTVMVAVAVLVLGCGLTACEWSLRPSFTVTSTDTAVDAAPGDGVCETAAGNGVCTLPAAIGEANELGVDTDLIVPTGDYAAVDVLVTGKVRINDGRSNRISVAGVTVAAGGQLIIDGLTQSFGAGPSSPVRVDGVLVMRHSSIMGAGTQIWVGATGVAGLENVTVHVGFATAIQNDGFLALRNVTVGVFNLGTSYPTINTGALGTTRLESSLLVPLEFSVPSGPAAACAGTTPISVGANAAWDASCGLNQPDDQPNASIGTTFAAGPTVPSVVTLSPDLGSSAVDAIEVGSHNCGGELVDDQVGTARPVDADGDPDTPAACDIGAVEVQPF